MSRTKALGSVLALALVAVLTLDFATVSTRIRTETSPIVASHPPPRVQPPSSPRPTQTANPCPQNYNKPDPARPVMDLRFSVGSDYSTVTGHEQVTFTPDVDLRDVVLRLWPNSPVSAGLGGSLTLNSVTVQGSVVQAVIEQRGTLARMRLPVPGVRGLPISVVADFTLKLPRGANERYGYQPGLAWFGSGFPLLAFEPGKGWATEPPTSAFAEATTSPAMSVNLSVTVPSVGDQVVGPGTRIETAGRTTRFRADAIRDVAVAVGRFTAASGKSAAGVPIDAYVAAGLNDSAAAYVQDQVHALDDHSARIGPYPYPRLESITLPAIHGGIEYPGVIFYGVNQHGRTTSHEVAHQWFYALVGNDQARDPWLDESFATFIEALDDRSDYNGVPIPTLGLDKVGAPMSYWESHTGDYFTSVYLQGATALIRARAGVGASAFDHALRCFVHANAYRIATAADFERSFRRLPGVVAELRRVGALPIPAGGRR